MFIIPNVEIPFSFSNFQFMAVLTGDFINATLLNTLKVNERIFCSSDFQSLAIKFYIDCASFGSLIFCCINIKAICC